MESNIALRSGGSHRGVGGGGGGAGGGGGERSVAVAVDKEKSSQYALKWAIDHIITKDETVKLIHVKERPQFPQIPTSGRKDDSCSLEPQTDSNISELLLPFRCYCRRRQVQCETVVLEDLDVAKSLIEYVCQNGIETLLLGTASRNGLSRLFKTTDIPGNVLKWAPDFCTVYVISKGKINTVRNATRPVPTLSAGRAPSLAPRNMHVEPATHDNS
ncbi:U-box domain-containing protein 52 [Hevea brasiliensis]|uniref:U-box domain-containing protein 52 n=1 Tax=Hevea brasiliensis TaxID=3981 RepID=UPI0025E62B73|nr:U-box domain-containing protein 52 [Hevea brasiliensis]